LTTRIEKARPISTRAATTSRSVGRTVMAYS
jgi:hypothetical protein